MAARKLGNFVTVVITAILVTKEAQGDGEASSRGHWRHGNRGRICFPQSQCLFLKLQRASQCLSYQHPSEFKGIGGKMWPPFKAGESGTWGCKGLFRGREEREEERRECSREDGKEGEMKEIIGLCQYKIFSRWGYACAK
jgi:hypothetical protein